MINLDTSEFITSIVIIFIGYCISVTLAGAFHAWIAHKMGDDTAADLGLTSLNPVVHINTIGLAVYIMAGWCWGTYIPVNPFNIIGKWRKLRIFIATYADIFIYILTSIIAMTVLLIFDKNIHFLPPCTVLGYCNLPLTLMTYRYPDTSSVMIIICLLLMSFIRVNIGMSTISMAIHTIDICFWTFTKQSRQYFLQSHSDSFYKYVLIMLIFIVIFSFFINYCSLLLFSFILKSSSALVHLFGIK